MKSVEWSSISSPLPNKCQVSPHPTSGPCRWDKWRPSHYTSRGLKVRAQSSNTDFILLPWQIQLPAWPGSLGSNGKFLDLSDSLQKLQCKESKLLVAGPNRAVSSFCPNAQLHGTAEYMRTSQPARTSFWHILQTVPSVSIPQKKMCKCAKVLTADESR